MFSQLRKHDFKKFKRFSIVVTLECALANSAGMFPLRIAETTGGWPGNFRYRSQAGIFRNWRGVDRCLFSTVEFLDEAAAFQLIDKTQIDKIFSFGFGNFGVPGSLHFQGAAQPFQGRIGIRHE
jgi:hypothetical protein